ncbi:MAG: helix-turn-helix domain-containing protein [Treponema sp.]|nr:helix-turn-helix domain-containing protein [Treponema sp.]
MKSNFKPMNAEEAAAYLGLSKKALYNMVSAKKISCYRPNGKLLYFSREDCDTYAFRNRSSADFELHAKAEDLLNSGSAAAQNK